MTLRRVSWYVARWIDAQHTGEPRRPNGTDEGLARPHGSVSMLRTIASSTISFVPAQGPQSYAPKIHIPDRRGICATWAAREVFMRKVLFCVAILIAVV